MHAYDEVIVSSEAFDDRPLDVVEMARGRPRVLFLDYDGILVPFAATPEHAEPDLEVLDVLERLSARADTAVHIVTSRARASLETWLGHLPVGLHAEHGFWRRRHRRAAWIAPLVGDHARWMRPAMEAMEAATRDARGSFVERKTASLAWHYRLSDPSLAARARTGLRRALLRLAREHDLEMIDGHCVVELHVKSVHKGHVVRDVLEDADPSAFVLAVGDDVTDEAMYAALPRGAVAVCAGMRASRAAHRVAGPPEVRHLLAGLAGAPEDEWVLVVDDNPGIRRVVLDVLIEEGISAVAVADGVAALDVLRRGGRLPSVVLTDMTMPVLDGRGLITRIRKDPELAALPIVMMTAIPYVIGLPSDVPVVNKPFRPEYLISLLRERMGWVIH